MGRKAVDMTGQIFNRLTVLYAIQHPKQNRPLWVCMCICGNTVEVLRQDLISGAVQSCKCLRQNQEITHGLSKHPIYKVYWNMVTRCSGRNRGTKYYKNYYLKDITVCKEWLNDFLSFYNWAINHSTYSPGLTIDRIDPNGNYCPENCKWSTREEQDYNKTTTVYVDAFGETLLLHEAISKYAHISLNKKLVYTRLKRGWNAERSLTTPRFYRGSAIYPLCD